MAWRFGFHDHRPPTDRGGGGGGGGLKVVMKKLRFGSLRLGDASVAPVKDLAFRGFEIHVRTHIHIHCIMLGTGHRSFELGTPGSCRPVKHGQIRSGQVENDTIKIDPFTCKCKSIDPY